MSDNPRSLIEKYQAFYEVSPYYVVLEENHGDVYGVNIDKKVAVPGPDPDYASGYEELRKIAQDILEHHANCFSFVDVIPFPEAAILNSRRQAKGQVTGKANVQARLRIRISHRRGLEQPESPLEERLLNELEKHLQGLGLKRQ
jgi:hypothetical protein